ncbi:MAG TPA: DUF929 family protein [Ktedonobacterales bacterium]
MAKSKRPQQPKRIGQDQPAGVARATASARTGAAMTSKATGATNGKAASPANGASPSRLNAIRERAGGSSSAQARRPAQRARYARVPWWRRNLGALIVGGVVVILVGVFIAFASYQNKQASVGIGSPVPSSIMKTLTTIPASEFASVGPGSTQILGTLNATPANTPLLTAGGKPEVIYVGAEYCPYCAAERWSTVIALSRFGSFSGLELMRSSSTDQYANTPTLSFRNATYTSKYLTFSMTETEDRSGAALATPASDVLAVFNQYQTSPYTTSPGAIPFMSFGNQYITSGASYIPSMLTGLDWQQVATQLQNSNSATSQAVIGTANYQTAAICKLTNNQPGNVCGTTVIQELEAKLPAAK